MGVSLAHDTACGVLFTLHTLGSHRIQQPSRPKTAASPPPGPTDNGAEHIFLVGTCTQSTHKHYVYKYIHGQTHRSQTSILRTHPNPNISNSLILLSSQVVQDRGRPFSRKHACMCRRWFLQQIA